MNGMDIEFEAQGDKLVDEGEIDGGISKYRRAVKFARESAISQELRLWDEEKRRRSRGDSAADVRAHVRSGNVVLARAWHRVVELALKSFQTDEAYMAANQALRYYGESELEDDVELVDGVLHLRNEARRRVDAYTTRFADPAYHLMHVKAHVANTGHEVLVAGDRALCKDDECDNSWVFPCDMSDEMQGIWKMPEEDAGE